jgi:hypothetical protein
MRCAAGDRQIGNSFAQSLFNLLSQKVTADWSVT